MKKVSVALLFVTLIAGGCSKDRAQNNIAASPAPDNSGVNARDRGDQTKTAGDQSESEADRTISQNIRQALSADDSLSPSGKNAKIIIIDGKVTLRGPVKNDQERTAIAAKAQQIAGVVKVDNQLEIMAN